MFFLISSAHCWSDEALVIATEMMFRTLGDNGPNLIKKVLSYGDETLERPSLASAFLSYVERRPYNTHCFNHWRYTQRPFNDGITEFTAHSNQDDLAATFKNLNDSIVNGKLNGPWPYSFGFKALLTTFLESYDPMHNVEYFSPKFPDGDDSGRKYYVYYKGKRTTLAEFWESGCGRYTKKVPFTSQQWEEIDKEVTQEFLKNTKASFNRMITHDPLEAQLESYNISVESVYKGIEDNQITDEYYNKCVEITSRRMAMAGYSLASYLKYKEIPEIKKNAAHSPLRTSEAIGWSITCLLLPITIYIVWNYFQAKRKLD